MAARKITTEGSDRLTVTLEAEDRAKLTQLSERTDRSLAWLVRDAIKKYLDAETGRGA